MKWFFVGGCLLILLAFMVWRFSFGEVFSVAVLTQLKPGMTTNEVVAILGPPSSIGFGRWVYARPLMRNVGLVYFDEGHLRTAIND
jgi:hypothetical protein